MRILVIDDLKDHQKIIGGRLARKLGAQMLYASTGEEALALADQFALDCILLDFGLPTMNGLEVMRELHKRCNSTPVIMVTGHGSEQVAVQAMKQGAFDYIMKEMLLFRFDEVVSIVEKAINHRRMLERLQDYQNRLTLYMELADEVFFQIDEKNQWVYINEASFKLFGCLPSEMLHKKIDEFFPEDDWTEINRNLSRLRDQSEVVITSPIRIMRKNGVAIEASWIARLLQEPHMTEPTIAGKIAIRQRGKKVPERDPEKELEDKKYIEMLENLVVKGTGYLEEMIGSLLSAITAPVPADHHASPAVFEHNAALLQFGDPLHEILHQAALAREYSKLKIDLKQLQPVDLKAVIVKVIRTIYKDVELVIPETLPLVRGDAAYLHQLIVCLLIGRRVLPGSQPNQVIVALVPPPKKQKTICLSLINPWFTLPPATPKDAFIPFGIKEVGIKLAMAKKIVGGHGGKIWLERGINQGTTFFFSLPAEPSP